LLTERGPLRGRQIDRHFRNVDWRRSMQWLVRHGLVASRSVLPPPSVRPKFVRTAQLAVPPEQAEAAMPSLGKTASTLERRGAALRFLIREPEAVNVAWVYAGSGCNLADLQELAERDLIILRETEIWRDPLARDGQRPSVPTQPRLEGGGAEANGSTAEQPLVLTAQQGTAWGLILKPSSCVKMRLSSPSCFTADRFGQDGALFEWRPPRPFAGSSGDRPGAEIASPQTVQRFLRRFPGQVG
jgi:primosomal protein N' (replication factor Y)